MEDKKYINTNGLNNEDIVLEWTSKGKKVKALKRINELYWNDECSHAASKSMQSSWLRVLLFNTFQNLQDLAKYLHLQLDKKDYNCFAEGKDYVSWFRSVLHYMNYRPSFADLVMTRLGLLIIEIVEGSSCDVYPFNDSHYDSIKSIELINVIFMTETITSEPITVKLNQALNFTESMNYSLICVNQTR